MRDDKNMRLIVDILRADVDREQRYKKIEIGRTGCCWGKGEARRSDAK